MDFSKRTGFLTLLFVSFVFANLLPMACSIKKPQAPSWYSDWSLPIMSRRIDMVEILSRFDETNVYFDSAGNPGIDISQLIDTVSIRDQLTINSARLDMKDSLGTIEMEPPAGAQSIIMLNQLLQPIMGYIPPGGFNYSQQLETLERFNWAMIERGQMRLTVLNALEVDLDTVIVTVIDASDSHVIGIVVFEGGIRYLDSRTGEIDLAGQRISNTIQLAYHGHTPGGPLVNISGQYLQASMSFPSTLTISAAQAEIPQITRTKKDLYEIEDSTEVQLAVVSSGQLAFDVFNDTDLPCSVIIHSPNFRLREIDFNLTGQLAAHSRRSFTVDMAGYSFVPQGAETPQQVEVEMINTISASAPVRHIFHASDSLSLYLDVSEIEFQSLTGRIKPTHVDIDPVTRAMDLPDGIDQSRLTHASLAIAIVNNSMVPASLDLRVAGGGKLINLAGIVTPKDSPSSLPLTTIFAATPEQTLDFFDPPPDEIVIYGVGVINPDYRLASLTRNDYFAGELTILTPFAMAIDDTISFSPEILNVHIDDSRPDNISDRVFNASLRAVLENRLPLGTRVTLFVGVKGDSSLYADTSAFVMGPYSVGPAEIGPSGEAVQPSTSMVSDSINSSRLWLFENDSVFVGQIIEIFPTDTMGININGSDYLGVRANASMRIRIGD
jgi:hypothetical protein